MSRGLSWRQHTMLESIAREATRWGREGHTSPDPVAWRAIDRGPTSDEGRDDFSSPRVQWNHEQAMRRSLRSLEQRGLVELGSYCFLPVAEMGAISPRIFWVYRHPDDYVPGEMRIMTGAVLTEAGWLAVRQRRAERAKRAEAEPKDVAHDVVKM